jgi:outer membrane receptor protein involved in Fe transport
MKKGLLGISIFFLLISGYGQEKSGGRITGKVMDSALNVPLEFATITLLAQGKNPPLNGTTADTSGRFLLTNVPTGTFRITIESLGYQPLHIGNVTINQKHEVIDLKQVFLRRKQETLQGVTVTAQQKLVENKIDKVVFNAERDITSQTGVATDVLKKVPQVSVDVDGNVELGGSTGIRFLINGKPSTMFGSNITDVLQSIPANQIKSIEVITNPGAKYDAQGLNGIINIILKHSTVQGVNGSASLTTGTLNQNGSVNINARRGKFGLNAYANGNARLTTTTPASLQRISTDTATKNNALLTQDGSSDFNRHGFQTGIGFDWTYREKNNFSGALNYGQFGNNAHAYVNQFELIENAPGAVLSEINSTNSTKSNFNEHNIDPSLNYKRTFSNEDQELEIAADGSFGSNKRMAGNDQFLQPQDSLIYGTRSSNPAKENEYEITVDYLQPLHKDIKLGIGGKFSAYDISSISDAFVWQSPYKNYFYDSALSNNLDYHQKVYATYAELSLPIGQLVEIKAGGRYEHTQVNSFYSNAGQEVNKNYNTFVPSIFLMRKLGEKQTLKLNYSKRINRPDYGELNPYINTSDPKNVSTGNPELKPELQNRYELAYNNDLGRTGSFIASLFYRISKNDIQPFIVYYPSIRVGDTTYTNVAVTTRENVGTEKNAGASIFFDLHLNAKFNVRSNFIFFYRHTINEVNKGYNTSNTNYRFNINASYEFTKELAAECFGNFSSPRHEAQGRYPSFVSYSMAMRQQLWKKKASIAISANNIFSKYVNQETDLFGPGFVTTSVRKIPFRSVSLNFTWKFGKLQFKKEKKEENSINLGAPEQ